MSHDELRTTAWLDSLDDHEERAEALHVLGLPGGSHASAYVAVNVFRIRRQLDEMATPMHKRIAKSVISLGAVIGATIASYRQVH